MNQSTVDKTKINVVTLEEVMKYENIDVIDRFMQSWDIPFETSQDIFNEMKKWLWLCASHLTDPTARKKVPNLAITQSMALLDEMWHAFILFTKPYAEFCDKHFGFFIHHGPTTNSQKEEVKEKIKNSAERFFDQIEKDLTSQYEYIYDQLGEDTLQKWYSDWTDLYTTEHLNKLYKKQW